MALFSKWRTAQSASWMFQKVYRKKTDQANLDPHFLKQFLRANLIPEIRTMITCLHQMNSRSWIFKQTKRKDKDIKTEFWFQLWFTYSGVPNKRTECLLIFGENPYLYASFGFGPILYSNSENFTVCMIIWTFSLNNQCSC